MDQAMANDFLAGHNGISIIRQTDDGELALFSTIDEATKTWLNSLHYIWGLWKKSQGVTKTLTDYFETAPNPYLSTLRILVNTNDFSQSKTKSSLSFTVMEDFSKWIAPNKDLYKDHLVVDLKLAAFKLVSRQKNMQLMKMVAETYEFTTCNELFYQIIEDMLRQKKYKEAAQYAEMLNLQPFFAEPEILLLPLILQNKVTVVEDFLANQPDIQKNLVQYLDNLLAPGKSIQIILDKFITENNIPDVKMSTVQLRPMSKLVARLAKIYKLPVESCPYLNQKRGEGAMQFLIYKRFVDCSLSAESWREMAREAVGDDERLQLELIKSLSHTNAKEALYFAKSLNVPRSEWPWNIAQLDNENPDDEGASGSAEENLDVNGCVNYHTLKLPRECIILVNDKRSFEEFLDELMKGVSLVGIDSEWKPSFGTKKSELALIQIATETNVYILDTFALGNDFKDLWSELSLLLFENKNVIKLGFGLTHDIAMMRESLPALSNVRAGGQGYMDLLHVWRKLVHEHNFEFPYQGDSNFSGESLSKLVELCLGNRLNKSDQFSNWERRPLRESQIVYAALDAYCLLEVYDALSRQCSQMDIQFQEVSSQVQHIPHKSPKKSVKKATRNQVNKVQTVNPEDQQVNNTPVVQAAQMRQATSGIIRVEQRVQDANPEVRIFPIPAHEWRVVCDSMLGGLAKQLRMCGCNCIHIEYDRGGDQSMKIAMNENRVLLTRNGCYQRFTQCVPAGSCYKVVADKPEDQLKEVLSRFNIVVTERDIFSRCQVCNQDEFVRVPETTMAALVNSYMMMMRGHYYRKCSGPSASSSQFEAEYEACASENVQSPPNRPDSRHSKHDRTWRLSADTLDLAQCKTKYGILVKIDKVPPKVLRNVNCFYICERCGKVYWDGSHMERALNGVLKDVIVHQ
ncbi:exonuclease mut-7 homolog isoform X2 [Belonocnema kinseyi]|uniref:exonuclease mut-7 homolog isoform X2 n=1 Tax=Belonocnema kinseyi TaxID=2817044 RepID=UPI00143CDB78|nr:exonuclease mut-7 homolog isoform X2 [Belonocnema kinseyi]